MIYEEVKISPKLSHWTAQPSNWEELAFTLNNEPVFLSYNPNEKIEMDGRLRHELNLFL